MRAGFSRLFFSPERGSDSRYPRPMGGDAVPLSGEMVAGDDYARVGLIRVG